MVTIVAALISAGAAITVCLITSHAQNNKIIAELNRHNDLQLYRIEELEKKVNKHNSVIERTFRLEERAQAFEHRLGTLEATTH